MQPVPGHDYMHHPTIKKSVIYPDFSLDLTEFFPGKHLIQF